MSNEEDGKLKEGERADKGDGLRPAMMINRRWDEDNDAGVKEDGMTQYGFQKGNKKKKKGRYERRVCKEGVAVSKREWLIQF